MEALEPGTRSCVSVRPEDIQLSEARPSGDNVLARARSTRRCSSASRSISQVKIGERPAAVARASRRCARGSASRIYCALDPEKCVALKDTPE